MKNKKRYNNSSFQKSLRTLLLISAASVAFSSCSMLSELLGLGLADEGFELGGSENKLGYEARVSSEQTPSNSADLYGLFPAN